jgi:hypothetical protein
MNDEDSLHFFAKLRNRLFLQRQVLKTSFIKK